MAKELTPEDYARIRREALAVRARAMGETESGDEACAGTSSSEAVSVRSRTSTSRATKRAHPPRKPKYDRAVIEQMFHNGMRVVEIASALGAHRGTIHRVLTECGGYERSNGPRRRATCKYGHDLSEHGIELPGGGRDCRLCRRRRDREAKKRKYWEAKAASQKPENQNSGQEAA